MFICPTSQLYFCLLVTYWFYQGIMCYSCFGSPNSVLLNQPCEIQRMLEMITLHYLWFLNMLLIDFSAISVIKINGCPFPCPLHWPSPFTAIVLNDSWCLCRSLYCSSSFLCSVVEVMDSYIYAGKIRWMSWVSSRPDLSLYPSAWPGLVDLCPSGGAPYCEGQLMLPTCEVLWLW